MSMVKAQEFVPKIFKTKSYQPRQNAICKTLLCFLISGKTKMKIRIIMDSAGELNVIKKNVADAIGLNGDSCLLHMITTGGDVKLVKNQREVSFQLKSLNGNYISKQMFACTAPSICDPVPPMRIDPKNYNHLKNIEFTEPLPQCDHIGKNNIQYQLLIGEPNYSDLCDETQFPFLIKTDNPDPDAVEPSCFRTYLGWSLCGGYKSDDENPLPNVRMVKAKIFQTKIFKNPEQEFAFNALVKKYDADFDEDDHDHKSLRCIQMLWNLETIGVEPADSVLKYTKDEQEAVDLMKQITKFEPEKRRWVTGLLWRNPKKKVRNTNEARAQAVAKSLERKYQKADAILAKYPSNSVSEGFMAQINKALLEFLSHKFMTLASAEEKAMKKHYYYMQFHAVVDETRNTKVRVVLNAASQSEDDKSSLNGNLYPGPVLLPSLLKTLIAFRKSAIGFTCDLSKCYLRTHMRKQDQQYLRLKWRWGNLDEDFETYVFRRLPFGISSAPFQSAFIIRENAILFEDTFPTASKIIQTSTYVDDLVSSCEDEDQCVQTIQDIVQIFGRGGYEVHKFCSNSQTVMDSLPEALKCDLEQKPVQKILGCSWNTKKDSIIFPLIVEEKKSVKSKKGTKLVEDHVMTRRKALSIASSLFDPQGLLSPLTLLGRNIIQDSWRLGPKLGWDDPLPPMLAQQTMDFKKSLKSLAGFELPRCLVQPGFIPNFIAAFSDGSDRGYATVVYLVSDHPAGERDARLVFGKARAAPVKVAPWSTPKCELMGALLSVRACLWIKETLGISNVHYFSDSQITLHRINKNPAIYTVWCANRLIEIRKHSKPEDWHFVTGEENTAADLASRGCDIETLLKCEEYWHGPKFLREKTPWRELGAYTNELRKLDQEELPPSRNFDKFSKNCVLNGAAQHSEKVLACLKVSLAVKDYEKTHHGENELFNRIFHCYESWRKSVRLVCRIFRFINIVTKGKFQWKWEKSEPDTHCACKKPVKFLSRSKEFIHVNGLPVQWLLDECKKCKMKRRPRNHFVAYQEFRNGELYFFKMTQRKYFFEDLKVLNKAGKTFEDLPQNSAIKSLSPFVDATADVIRMTSRIRQDSLICASVDPVILPKDSEVMRKWVRFIHVTHNHAPTETLISKCRFFCWIIQSRRTIKRVLSSMACICRRVTHARPLNQRICPLPNERLGQQFVPWRYQSCDYLGPLMTGPPAAADQPAPPFTPHYVLLFTCLQTRAIHLVLNHEMTTESFIQSLRAHTARNGVPEYLLSDHQKNLHAADKVLKQLLKTLNWNNIKEQSDFEWKFSTELSPWKNSCSETMVKLVKQSLRVMLRACKADLYEVTTLLAECECLVNERSLSYITDDDASEFGPEFGPLTPNLLSKGRPAGLLPDLPRGEKIEYVSLNKKLLHRKRLLNAFEKRWRSAYLSKLSLAGRWREKAKIEIRRGLIVILKDDTMKMARAQWKLGIITEVIPSNDGKIRTVMVRVYNKNTNKCATLRRSVQKLSVTEASMIENEHFLEDPWNEIQSNYKPATSDNSPEPVE